VNHNKVDNAVKNLKWANLDDMIAHQQNSPAKKAYKEVQANRNKGLKLNAKQVAAIKKVLLDENRKITIKKLAEKYKVSEMTMYRIKSGENWGRV
jgi:DNA invertase Pin-like site-specific DNA recombinase